MLRAAVMGIHVMRSMVVRFSVALSVAGACADATWPDALPREGSFAAPDVVQGRLQILVADMHDGTARRIHRVLVDGDPVELTMPDDAPAVAPRSLVRAWGHHGDSAFVVDELEILAPPPEPLVDADPLAPRKLATILVHWGTPDISADEARDKMYDGATSTQKYFSEISYGKETITGDIFGPYQIGWTGGCDPDAIAQSAINAMADAGENPSAYEQLMYVFPEAGCGWGGLAMLGAPDAPERDSWYNGYFDCVVRNQEVAHNYGLLHTHFYYGCSNGGPFGSSCAFEEYGSPYDPMGYGCGHMAAPQKHYMGWLEGCNIVTATSDGTFNLVPTEVPCNGTQALRLPTFDGRHYYLEYRQPIGFDEEQSGVLVHVSGGWDYYGPDAYMIDLGEGGFLRSGESYTDPNDEVTFTVLEEHETHAVIDVTFPGGGSGAPTCLGGGAPEEQAGVIGTLECLGGPFQPDPTPPTVAIVDPQDGAVFAPGSDFTITAEASDDVEVAQVALYVDGELGETRTEPPWEWHVNEIPEGEYVFVAVASDGFNEAESAPVHVEVRTGAGDDGPADDGGGPGDDASDDGAADGSAEEGGDGIDDTDDALPPGFGLDGEARGCAVHPGDRAPARRTALALWALAAVTLGRRRRSSPG